MWMSQIQYFLLVSDPANPNGPKQFSFDILIPNYMKGKHRRRRRHSRRRSRGHGRRKGDDDDLSSAPSASTATSVSTFFYGGRLAAGSTSGTSVGSGNTSVASGNTSVVSGSMSMVGGTSPRAREAASVVSMTSGVASNVGAGRGFRAEPEEAAFATLASLG